MSKTRIGGITVEIGADTSGLSKKLKDVESESKKTKSELKSVNDALKQAPNSVELWKQKQELLSKAVENSKKKLEALVSEQKNMLEGLKNGKVTEEAYKAYQREIEITKGQIESAEKALNDFENKSKESGNTGKKFAAEIGGAFEKTGDKIEQAGQKVTEFGDSMTKAGEKASAASAVIAGAAAASYKAWEQTDEGYDTIVKKTGATGEALKELTDVADSVFTTLPTDMKTVGTAIGEVNTRFGATGDQLEELTKAFIKYSDINDSDVNGSIDNVSAAMKAFGVDGKDTVAVLDKLSSIAQRTGIPVTTLEGLLTSQSATFKEMGLSIGESAELLGQFEINGVDTATAMSALKKAQQNAAASGKTLSEELRKNIEDIKNAGSETDALNIASELFGKKGSAAMVQAIREDRIALGQLDGSLEDTAGTVEKTFEATLDAPDELKVALNQVKLEASGLAAVAMTKLAPALKRLTDRVKEITQRFNSLSDSQKETILKISGIVAAIGPALIAIGKVTSGIGGIISTVGSLMKSLGSVMTFISANPAALVIAGIAAVVAAGVVLYQQSEDFRELVNYLVADIASFAEVVVADLKDMWKSVKPILEDIWEIIQDLIDILEKPLSAVLIVVEKAFKAAWTAIKIVWDAVIPYFTVIVDGIKNIFKVVKGVLTGDFQGAWDGIKAVFGNTKQFFSGIWSGIKEVFSTVGTFFKNTFSAAWSGVKDVFSKGGKAFEGITEGIYNAFKKIVDSLIDGINEVVSVPFNAINKVLGKIKNIKIVGAKPFKWMPTIDVPEIPHLPELAKGGTLTEGQAIIAEAGPELIQLLNGKAKVTPLTGTAKNTSVQSTAQTPRSIYQTFNVYVKEFASAQDARTTSQELARLQRQGSFGKGLAPV